MATTSQDNIMAIQNVLEKHEPVRSSLIPILQNVQSEVGYLPAEAVLFISRYLKIPEAEIFGVATFYAQFRFSPIGKNVFTICRGTACHVRGSAQILEELERELGICAGATAEDLSFTILTVACIGSCALAPLTVLNGKVYGRTTKSKIRSLVDQLRKGAPSAGGNGGSKEEPEADEDAPDKQPAAPAKGKASAKGSRK